MRTTKVLRSINGCKMITPTMEKRKGRGTQKTTDLINAAIAILDEIQPTTIRSVCYQLFIRKLISSMAKSNTNKVGSQLVWAREQGLLSWQWIVDETREAERIASWNKPKKLSKQQSANTGKIIGRINRIVLRYGAKREQYEEHLHRF